MVYDSVIVDSHVVLPSGVVDRNIVIDGGRIVRITGDTPPCDRRIDGAGLVSLPGMIDTHVHYGVYSPIERAARTESHAAAVGGVTTMMRMLRLGSSYRGSLGAQLDASSGNHYVDYAVHASIFDRGQVEEMGFIRDAGVASFKIYMNLGSEIGHVYMDMAPGSHDLVEAQVELDSGTVEEIVRRAGQLGCPVCVHAEDYESCACGMREARSRGRDGLSAWSSSRGPESEAKAIRIVSDMARRHDCTVYFVHIGSKEALKQIEEERAMGTRIFVETCPHYLTLSHEGRGGYLAKVMPPIRSRADVDKVWEAACRGGIDTIGTDHVANRLDKKLGGRDVWGALAGFPGIGTVLPLLLSEGVNRERMNLGQLAALCSTNAARIFSMYPRKGVLAPGSDADVTMVDLKREVRVSSGLFGGFSDYTVYEGWNLKGWPRRTIVRGNVVAEDLEVVGRPGWGEFVPRYAQPAGSI